MADRIFIIAGTRDEFTHWRKFNFNPVNMEYQNLIYVDDLMRLKGIHKPHGRFIGSWYRRRDIDQIIFQLLVVGSISQDQLERIIAIKDKLNHVSTDIPVWS